MSCLVLSIISVQTLRCALYLAFLFTVPERSGTAVNQASSAPVASQAAQLRQRHLISATLMCRIVCEILRCACVVLCLLRRFEMPDAAVWLSAPVHAYMYARHGVTLIEGNPTDGRPSTCRVREK
ncbi:hypothetical protein V2G26_005626 [Clonostachys chloroleuca]